MSFTFSKSSQHLAVQHQDIFGNTYPAYHMSQNWNQLYMKYYEQGMKLHVKVQWCVAEEGNVIPFDIKSTI